MVDVKYQVFVSSTFTDLKAERNQAISAILESGNIPVGMEAFAGTDKQENVIKRAIKNADIYLIILGSRYGALMKDSDISYTEWEYNLAESFNKPIIKLELTSDFLQEKLSKNYEDNEIANPKYQAFKNRLESSLVSWVSTMDGIDAKTQQGIHTVIKENADRLVGFVPADTKPNQKLIESLQKSISTKEAEIDRLRSQVAKLSSEKEFLQKQPEGKLSLIGFNDLFRVHDDDKVATEVLKYIESYWKKVVDELKKLPGYSEGTKLRVTNGMNTVIFTFDYSMIQFKIEDRTNSINITGLSAHADGSANVVSMDKVKLVDGKYFSEKHNFSFGQTLLDEYREEFQKLIKED